MLCFEKPIRSFFIVSFATLLGSGLYGCASTGIQTNTGEPVNDVFSTFARGDARLTCGLPCSGAAGASRRKKKSLYENALWKDLALEVAIVGYERDREYFYFGRAAEGLGYMSAARTYYMLALENNRKCDGLINVCDGFVFPRDINVRLNILEQAKREAAEESARAAAEKSAREVTKKSAQEAAAKEAAEKSAREAAHKEAAEKSAREVAAKETAEKLAKEKEAARKLVREASDRVAAEKALTEKIDAEKAASAKAAKDSTPKSTESPQNPTPVKVRSVMDL